jgi:hypothetical protein
MVHCGCNKHVLLLWMWLSVAPFEEGDIKASSLPVPLLRSLTGQVSVKERIKKGRLFFQLTHV